MSPILIGVLVAIGTVTTMGQNASEEVFTQSDVTSSSYNISSDTVDVEISSSSSQWNVYSSRYSAYTSISAPSMFSSTTVASTVTKESETLLAIETVFSDNITESATSVMRTPNGLISSSSSFLVANLTTSPDIQTSFTISHPAYSFNSSFIRTNSYMEPISSLPLPVSKTPDISLSPSLSSSAGGLQTSTLSSSTTYDTDIVEISTESANVSEYQRSFETLDAYMTTPVLSFKRYSSSSEEFPSSTKGVTISTMNTMYVASESRANVTNLITVSATSILIYSMSQSKTPFSHDVLNSSSISNVSFSVSPPSVDLSYHSVLHSSTSAVDITDVNATVVTDIVSKPSDIVLMNSTIPSIKTDINFGLSDIVSTVSASVSDYFANVSSSDTKLSSVMSFALVSAVTETHILTLLNFSSPMSEIIPSIAYNKISSFKGESLDLQPSSGFFLSSSVSHTPTIITATPPLNTFNDTFSFSLISASLSMSSISPTTKAVVSKLEPEGISSDKKADTIFSSSIKPFFINSSPVSSVYIEGSVTPVSEIMPDIKLIFEFEGDCDRLILNAKLQIEFWQALIAVISIETAVHIQKENVQPEDLTCHPFLVILLLTSLNPSDYSKIMERNISISNLGVPILDDMSVIEYDVKSVKVIPIEKGKIEKSTVVKPSLEKVDIMIIVIAGVLFGFLICMCAAIVIRECYKRKRAASFNLLDVPHVNLDMEDFTLTKIPRPQMIYNENKTVSPALSIANGSRPKRPKTLAESDTASSDTNTAHYVDADTIQVRIQPHRDGVVVGVTCTPPRSPTKESPSEHSSPRSEASDPSKQTLLKDRSSEFGMANPNFEAEEEQKSTTEKKYIIKEDEEEALL